MSSIMASPMVIVSRETCNRMADIRHIASWYRHPVMLIDKVALVRAFMICVTVMSTVMLPATQAQQAASATGCPTKCNSTLQLLSQLLKTPKECLDICVLYKSRCVLFQPSSNLLHPCVCKIKKILIESRQEFLLCQLKTIMTVVPARSQRRKAFLYGHGHLGSGDVENNISGRSRDYFIGLQVLRAYHQDYNPRFYSVNVL